MRTFKNTFNESILSSTNAGMVDANKKFAETLAKQGRHSTTSDKNGNHFDTFGHPVKVGDLVVTPGAFSTNMIMPAVITQMDIETDIPDAIMIYNPYSRKEERTTLPCVMKIFEHEKYLK